MTNGTYDEEVAALEEEKERLLFEKMGPVGAALNNVGQGLSWGYSDELAAGMAATLTAPFSPETFDEIYAEQLEEERKSLEISQKKYPKTAFVGILGGGIISGGTLYKAGTQILRNVPNLARLMGFGGAEGAAFATGMSEEGTGQLRDIQARLGIKDVGVGTAFGVLGGPLGAGAGALLRKLGSKVVMPIFRRATETPKGQAQRIVGRKLEQDEMGPAHIAEELERLGPRAVIADLGENVGALGRDITARPGRIRTIAANFLRNRQLTQQQQILKAAGLEDVDVGDYRRTFQAMIKNRATKAQKHYDIAYAAELEATEVLEELLKRPAVRSSVRKATNILKDEGLVADRNSVRFMQAVKEDLDDRISRAYRAGAEKLARRLINIKKGILKEVDSQVPDYATARNVFAGEKSLQTSAKMGRSLFGNKVNLDEIQDAVALMTVGERHTFRLGAVRGLIDVLEETPLDRNTAKRWAEASSARSREILNLAFPTKQVFDNFVKTATAETRFASTQGRVLGGSVTGRIAEGQKDLNNLMGFAHALRGDPAALGLQFLRTIVGGDVSEETLEEVGSLLFNRAVPKGLAEGAEPVVSQAFQRGAGVGAATAGTEYIRE
tara:strand:+ start:1963 stop:3795 length:1833 start_codon:yes stop_codon:yes gene_type:complete